MKVNRITSNSIRPYGVIIDGRCAKTRSDGNGWGILFRSRSNGWRVAYLILRRRKIGRLESHDSPETFEPVKGKAVIALATHGSPRRYKLFFLDKPIILKKGVWHGLKSISKSSHIKITENLKLTSKYHP